MRVVENLGEMCKDVKWKRKGVGLSKSREEQMMKNKEKDCNICRREKGMRRKCKGKKGWQKNIERKNSLRPFKQENNYIKS